jgi:hypothetical protein
MFQVGNARNRSQPTENNGAAPLQSSGLAAAPRELAQLPNHLAHRLNPYRRIFLQRTLHERAQRSWKGIGQRSRRARHDRVQHLYLRRPFERAKLPMPPSPSS